MKLLLAFLLAVPSAAFAPGGPKAAAFRTNSAPLRASSSSSKSETFERAVECAENFGYCDLDELETLSDELEDYQGNFFEHGSPDLEAKEVTDRNDVAEVLKLQAELRLRMDYMENANLFADDVHKEVEDYPEQAW
uniref:Uncharacterized protein n=1 Tax=Trieres chinensis TaxID=1514140 RepID=A0A7S1ZBE1_TRICV|mmetsp:Transcript_21941/g.44395  ORF Transcript_21941/g.44395 Transcript_21941/m.44395 type:complete len:136 (+) Transcript_21941:301-708(+)|eukprot:CAMPEP_0183299876 /NCGR_PEP_ID=MMETSP0160_2-20130417/6477_1 /TAXON_ID=2839 ORGANISM="Odontella Sinensis, Strain Grunow 1884" /NCGR_SAMPLE_ID=MMETSP0160_2 /ASSEMBLY_ACC=CAM_ASM_000250 /LENGTH=135 /DNA_ID=CAMNT_0025462197 /DNA_START=217 /DNA_END=624 /DNA_ORIENTATION=-